MAFLVFFHKTEVMFGDYSFSFLTGERRIRVHTMCLPVVATLSEVYLGADVQAITGLLANMGKHDKSLFGCVWMTALKL